MEGMLSRAWKWKSWTIRQKTFWSSHNKLIAFDILYRNLNNSIDISFRPFLWNEKRMISLGKVSACLLTCKNKRSLPQTGMLIWRVYVGLSRRCSEQRPGPTAAGCETRVLHLFRSVSLSPTSGLALNHPLRALSSFRSLAYTQPSIFPGQWLQGVQPCRKWHEREHRRWEQLAHSTDCQQALRCKFNFSDVYDGCLIVHAFRILTNVSSHEWRIALRTNRL